MKKIIPYILFTCLISFSNDAQAQLEVGTCKIATIARYTAKGVELRWMPDNKTILKQSFENGFTIERADSGTNRFENIANTKAFNQAKWEELITSEKDSATKSNLELAMEFLFANTSSEKKEISLDKGIAELNEQKSKEDMVYAIFVLTAIKDAKVAEALGLGFIDKNVQEGKIYTYRISLLAKSALYKIENGLVNIKASINPNKYKNEVFVYAGDKNLTFVWTANSLISGYFVERKAEGENIFKPLNTTPFYDAKGEGYDGSINGTFKDDSLVNYKWYQYRFYGLTSFGEKVLFAEVKGMPKDLTPPDAPILKLPKQINPKEVEVAWDMYGNLNDLKGFIVARSNKDSGNFNILHTTILNNKARKYIDNSFNVDDNNYYVVYALDTAGNISSSYPAFLTLIDSTPPAKPEIASAIVDSLGIVTLKIKLGKEKDLKGYRIFKSNSAEHELSVVKEFFKKDKFDTASIKTIFYDTVGLNSLTTKIFYRIKALDFNYNQSVFSDIAIVKRPDTIPPVTPVFTNVIVKENQIELYFAPSSSIDVKEQMLYRKTSITDDWKLLMKLKPTDKQLIDTNVKTGVTYYYSIRAVDESNLLSGFANMVYGKPYDSGVRPVVTNLSSKIQDKKVVLSWDYPEKYKGATFAIYKKNEKGDLVQYKKITEKIFIDNAVSKENVYAIKVFTPDGGQSALSNFISQKNN